ncbi:hypothetical protein HRbin40_01972 [bacterium HR40]|nr:hypothetical protein HRbin40_01972 [bacterium HR40]
MHPWLRPLRRRLALFALLLSWFALEAVYEPLSPWFFLVAAITIYALWDFFLAERLRGDDRCGRDSDGRGDRGHDQ